MDVHIIMSATVFFASLYAEENGRKGIKIAGFLSDKKKKCVKRGRSGAADTQGGYPLECRVKGMTL